MLELTIPVEGMTCGGCSSSVRRVLAALPEVAVLDVTLKPGAAVVRFDPAAVGPDDFRRVIEGAGFDVPAAWKPAID